MLILNDIALRMPGFEVIENLRHGLALTVEEFAARVDISRDAYYRWRRGETEPGDTSIARIEKALGVKFSRDPSGTITGIESGGEKRPVITFSESVSPYRSRTPRSAREVYEGFDNYGGKVEWIDLPEADRAYFEGVFARMEAAIDEARTNYEHSITQAVGECRKLVRDRLLGIR